MGVFDSLKDLFGAENNPEIVEEYVEIGTSKAVDRAKITVRPFVMKSFEDIRPILDSLREGYTIAFIDVKPLREKDIVELKRAVSKIKKTCDALEGDIAGFENFIIVTPSFAKIAKHEKTEKVDSE